MAVWRRRENLFWPRRNKIWPSWRKNRSISIPRVICRNCCKAFRRGAPFMKSFPKPDLSTTNDLWCKRSGKESFSEKVAVEEAMELKRWKKARRPAKIDKKKKL